MYAHLRALIAGLADDSSARPEAVLRRCVTGFDYLNDHRGRVIASAALRRCTSAGGYESLVAQVLNHLEAADLYTDLRSGQTMPRTRGYQLVCGWLHAQSEIMAASLQHPEHLQLLTSQLVYPRLSLAEQLAGDYALALELKPVNDGGWYQISPIEG